MEGGERGRKAAAAIWSGVTLGRADGFPPNAAEKKEASSANKCGLIARLFIQGVNCFNIWLKTLCIVKVIFKVFIFYNSIMITHSWRFVD